jgi:hypothetical protein
VEVESGGKPHAMRYEKNYRWLYKPKMFAEINGTTLETEKQLQKFSYGLMQVMGAVVREDYSYANVPRLSLYHLLNPEGGVAAGVRLLEKLYIRHMGFLDIISAYNQGSPRRSLITGKYKNQKYVDKVVAAAGRFGLDLL